MKKIERVDYRILAEQNLIFLKFISDYKTVQSFYPSPVHLSVEHLVKRAEIVSKREKLFPISSLYKILIEFNQRIEAGEATFSNIEKLKYSKTVAIVTGQQVGLFGGEAFAIYKALTAVRLAQILEEAGYSAVPVFWLASDDSDFLEVRSTTFRNPQGNRFDVTYPGPNKNTPKMVGRMHLSAIEKCLHSLEDQGLKGGFSDEILTLLRKCFRPERLFQEGLGAWLAQLFRENGLILFDALSDYKSEIQSLFRIAIQERSGLLQDLRRREQRVREKGLKPQVRVSDLETLLFWVDGENRHKLEYGQFGYSSQSLSGPKWSSEQLSKIVKEQEVEMAPNVLLRPILQDWLFPTVAYVGGPSEVAYFAQVNAISRRWNLETSIFPRASITLVDRKAQRLLRKYQLTTADFFRNSANDLGNAILSSGKFSRSIDDFTNLRSHMRTELHTLQTAIEKIDPVVADMMNRSEKKILYQLDRIQHRLIENERGRQSVLGSHLDYLYSNLYPESQLQERLMNFNQFLSEEGPSLISHLIETVDPFCPSHQVIYL